MSLSARMIDTEDLTLMFLLINKKRPGIYSGLFDSE